MPGTCESASASLAGSLPTTGPLRITCWPLTVRSMANDACGTISRIAVRLTERPRAASRSWPNWSSTLLDHLVCLEDERLGNRHSQRPGGLQIDHQLELRWPFNRQIGGLSAFEDFIHVFRCSSVEIFGVSSVGHEPARLWIEAEDKHPGQSPPRGEID